MSDDLAEYAAMMQAKRIGEPLGPSGVGTCFRQASYRYHGVPQTNSQSTDAADYGTLAHLGWSQMIRSMYDPLERDCDVLVNVPGLPRSGSADDVDYANRICTDLKTAGGRAFQNMVDKGEVYENYWRQISVYCYGLSLMYGGEWTMRVVLINRESGERAEFTQPADPDEGKRLVGILAERHEALLNSIMANGDPEVFPREGHGPGTGMPCGDYDRPFCGWLTKCWGEPAVVGAALSPQSATVVDDPDAIEGWAASYMEAQQQESKYRNARRDAGAFLAGISGVFGQFKITPVGGNDRPDQIDCAAAAEALTAAGLPVPYASGGTTAKYVKVSRVRK